MKHKLLFTAPVLTASGYGVHARQLLRALVDCNEFDICVESLRWGETPFLTDAEFNWITELSKKPVHSNPDIAIQVTIPNEFKRRAPLTIGITAGIEVDRVSPQWIVKCNSEVDFVIVPSEHSRNSFMVEYQAEDGSKLRLERPLFVVAEGVDTDIYKPNFTSNSSLLDDFVGLPPKNFIFTGLGLDKPQGRDRKNVTRLVEYFCKTFAGNKDIGLVLKVAIVNSSAVDFEIVKKRVSDIKMSSGCGEYPKIFIAHGRFPDSELANVYNDPRIIAAISLTHGEGFGLPIIEAAACGLPILATDWSGHLDFLSKDGKKLFIPLEFDLKEIPQECVWDGVMDAGTKWAEVKENDVAVKMQKMTMSSSTPRKWASELADHIALKYSLPATASVFIDLIKRAAMELSVIKTNNSSTSISLRDQIKAKGKSLLYTMPMSAGDVFLSTGVVSVLRRKYPEHRIYFATRPQYFDILKDLSINIVDEIVEYQPWMQDISACESIFDEVFTPNLAVQMVTSNWIHGGKGRNLIDEFATQCGLDINEWQIKPILPNVDKLSFKPSNNKLTVHAGGQKSARVYAHWSELIKNIRANGIHVTQVGAKDDISIGEVDIDLRGNTNHAELVKHLMTSNTFLGIDSYPMHVANVVGLRVIAIFGSSYGNSTGPKDLNNTDICDANMLISKESVRRAFTRLNIIETNDRNGCEKACYKDTCKVDSGNPCLNNIKPQLVFNAILEAFELIPAKYNEYLPKIAGYTHILNAATHGYPFVQSIKSMLGFCDEVIVVDGGSTDSTLSELFYHCKEQEKSGQLKIITREWDAEEPGMDGMQKAFGRAMCSPDMEFLWQQDADEVVHEDDYLKIKDICKRFPTDVDVIHLPVVELWGDDKHGRTDRHSWKWRLSRNNLRITHGINIQARLTDSKTGRIYSKPDQSDGCELIDMVTGNHLPHRGFYNNELEKIRVQNPVEYGQHMNVVYDKLPSVWHYSWADLPRKIRNFRDFWDKQWNVLYQTPAKPRFPDVVTDVDIENVGVSLKARGGEHESAYTFELTKNAPKVMEGWIK